MALGGQLGHSALAHTVASIPWCLQASQGQTGPQPWDPLVLELNDYLQQVESVTYVQPRAPAPLNNHEKPAPLFLSFTSSPGWMAWQTVTEAPY